MAAHFMSNQVVDINPKIAQQLSQDYQINSGGVAYLPPEIFEINSFSSVLLLVLAGLLVGFGSRYAGGCTSGHAISGLSNLQFPSLIAVIGFFIGGLLMIHVFFPFIF